MSNSNFPRITETDRHRPQLVHTGQTGFTLVD